MNKKFDNAFTLAEVLITLGIIGVVTALTIPTVINKWQAKVLENQFKKSYSTLNNAARALIEENNPPYEHEFYTCTSNCNDAYYKMLSDWTKVLNGSFCTKSWSGTNLTGKSGAHIISGDKAAICLNDGQYIMFDNYNYYRIYVDINGNKSKPNRLGYDMHTFRIRANNSVTPENKKQDTHDTRVCTYTNSESTDTYLGFGCSEFAATNKSPDGGGNYWYDFLYRHK